MTIEGGNVRNNAGSDTTWSGSSLICNGPSNEAKLIISGGNIQQDNFIAVKNDENGVLEITGGSISSKTQAVQNWKSATISGGNLTGAVTTWGYKNVAGETTISGNAYINGDVGTYWYSSGENALVEGTSPKMRIDGGVITGSIEQGSTADGIHTPAVDPGSDEKKGIIAVSGGQFGETVYEGYLSEGLNAVLKSAANEVAPYSYYSSVEGALSQAKPGDEISQIRQEEEQAQSTLELDYGYGGLDRTEIAIAKGDAFNLPTLTRPGYTFLGWYDGSQIVNGGSSYTVVGDVTLTAQWRSNYVPPVKPTPTYDVTLPEAEGGKLEVSDDSVKKGEDVTITVKPDEGQELRSISVTDKDGNALELVDNGDGTYTFEMPAGDVSISATFGCDGGALCPTHAYPDVVQSEWYHDAVDWAVTTGAMTGYTDGSGEFGVGDPLTRAQLAQVLYNQAGRPEVDGAPEFADCAADAWYADAVAWAASEGLMTGYEGTPDFGPDDVLTREMLAVVYWRAAGSPAGEGDLAQFPDGGEASDWAEDALSWAVGTGLLRGFDDTGELAPDGETAREQAATFFMRLAKDAE